jgi:hypothetical protein
MVTGAGPTTSYYRFSSSSSSDEERLPEGEHVSPAPNEEQVHFHYQSRRGDGHTYPIHTHLTHTNNHGGATKPTLWTPPLPIHTFQLPITTVAHITLLLLLWAPPHPIHTFQLPITTVAHITLLCTPLTSTNLHGRTLFFSGHPYPLPIYTGAHSSSDTPLLYTFTNTPSYAWSRLSSICLVSSRV